MLFAALRLRVRPGKYREPDLLVLRNANDPRGEDRFWLGAELVLEVVSPDKPDRDLVTKRADYAEGAIPEYWIVDPRSERSPYCGWRERPTRSTGASAEARPPPRGCSSASQ